MTMVSIAAGAIAGGGEIGHHRARGVGDLAGGAGVDQDELRSGVDQQHGERHRQDVGRQERRGERRIDRGAVGVAHELVVDLERPQAVIERGELSIAELVAIDAGTLREGLGRGAERLAACQCGGRGASQQSASADCGHDILPGSASNLHAKSMLGQIVPAVHSRLGFAREMRPVRRRRAHDGRRLRKSLLERHRPAGRAGHLHPLRPQDLRRAGARAARDRSLRTGLSGRAEAGGGAAQDLRLDLRRERLCRDRADQAAVRRGARRGHSDFLHHPGHPARQPAVARHRDQAPARAAGPLALRRSSPSSSRSRATSSSPSSAPQASTARP